MIKPEFLVEKRNILNEMRNNSMTLQEVRFLSIYLSKINARDTSTRSVIFPLEEFRRIMEIGRINTGYLQNAFTGILQKVVSIPNDTGGFTAFQLFKECRLFRDEEAWFVEIDAHDKALPLMFEFKEKYFTYELWNALKLKSSNQLRMYELLKQYEKIGEKTIKIDELKQLLGLQVEEYPVWADFKKKVLESCKKALFEHTDLCYEYEPIKKGRKFAELVFTIKKNDKYENQICLDEFLRIQELTTTEEPLDVLMERHALLSVATNNEFSTKQLDVIFNTICTFPIEKVSGSIDLGRYHYVKRKYAELTQRNELKIIKNRYNYFLKMIKTFE